MKMNDTEFILDQYSVDEKGYGQLFICGNPFTRCGMCLDNWNYQHELPYIEEIKKMLKPNSIGIDIGAHTGTYSIGLKEHISKMYSFEPLFPAFCALVKNSVNYPNIIPIYGSCGKETDNKQAPLINFGEFITSPVDFIKIDIEGQELFVLQELAPVICDQNNLVMLIEFEPIHYINFGYDYKDFFNALSDCGLDCTQFVESVIEPDFHIKDFCNILIQKVDGEVTARTLNYIKR